MKISTRWLLTFLPEQISTDNLINLLNRAGLTVESTSLTGCTDPNIIIAQILSSQKHPNADRLSICSVDDGSGQNRQIVCGASNYKVGDKVPLALPGATLPTGVKIKASNIRGVRSEGMLCSAAELALQDISDGLLILPPDAPIGSSFASFLPPDTILEIEVTPNRPDCLSYLGIARELAAFLDTKVIFTHPTLPFTTPNSEIAQIHTSSNCSFYTLRRIRGVRIAPSPLWLQRRLEASGIRPINNVVDVTNYVLLELGQPLHAFDALKLNPPISIRSANSSERFLALNGCEYTLTSSDTVIADQSNILAIGGVIGGESSAISDSTSEIWIESALFNPSSIRATSRRLGISTESSYRFERGVDPNAVILASTRATQLILELAGGQADDNIIVCGQLPNPPNPILLHHNYVNKLLGHIFSDTDIHNILSRICCPVLSQTSSNTSSWLPPSWRLDLKTQTDL
ncbi:MAG: phenylalanine--tRNA ligase subunit beta, partial [Chthoniobacterales bacterium]|nr:phenylalanine--tRNA ligase subunit beta [Chthoniobacterales bacterium]